MDSTNPKKETFAGMSFNGQKRSFGTWRETIKGFLCTLSASTDLEAAFKKHPKPMMPYEDMLEKVPVLTKPGEDAPDDVKEGYEIQAAIMKAQTVYLRNMLNRTLPESYRSQMARPINEMEVPDVWAQLERDFGQGGAQGMVEMSQEFDRALAMDFSSVSQLFARLKVIRNRINIQSHEKLQAHLIPSQLMLIKILGLLPSQYWGSSVSFTPQEFTIEKLEEKLKNIFGNKSRAQIAHMSKEVYPVNSVNAKTVRPAHRGTRKAQPVADTLGKRKRQYHDGRNDPQSDGKKCYYCLGNHNVAEGVQHKKRDCPKRALDIWQEGIYRRNVLSDKKDLSKLCPKEQAKIRESVPVALRPVRKEVPVDTVALQHLEPDSTFPEPTPTPSSPPYVEVQK